MKTLLFFITTFSVSIFSTFANAAETLPLQITRDDSGRLTEIRLITNKKNGSDSERFLATIRKNIREGEEELKNFDLKSLEKLKADEQMAFWEAVNYLSSKSAQSLTDDKEVDEQFLKAVETVDEDQFFTLIAAPATPNAFDKEAILREAINQAIDAAEELFGAVPAFTVFEFLIEEYLESLVSRREFYQNALLVAIASADSPFSAEEKAAIKSSIFYSRLSLTALNSRKKAIKEWTTFGNKAEEKWMKNCKVTEASAYHQCFNFGDQSLYNLVDKNHALGKGPSKAFDYKSPALIGRIRWFITAVKLGLKLAPVPGLVKKPVRAWLHSFYREQRRTEGLLYWATVTAEDPTLPRWIRLNTANPLLLNP